MAKSASSITLNQLRYFVRTVELGSMTATAEELFLAQSAVSTSIAQLEQAVGCKLLIRQRARGVVTTDQGSTFYRSAAGILAAVDEAVNQLSSETLTGTLTAGCFTTLAPFYLPVAFENLTNTYPELSLRISEVASEQISQKLTRRELEVVLTYGFDYGPEVEFIQLAEAPVYAAFGESHPLANQSEVSLEQLARESLILLDLGKSTNYFLSIFRDAHLSPRIHQRFESFEVVRSMVARGHGYTILNQRPAHDLTNDGHRLIRLPITDSRSLLQIGVAIRANESPSKKAQAFIKECREILTSS
ncbi:LysR family transcriptional regulator [Corynebacterium glutamicum]|uniref:LysR family transcriptional regulator n=1 Tax=Corynebacterium glutamicum TaxID=1718 RepID=UPI001B8CFF55|nr:LysR family transcriptional regulator [Corynebacterium glutamicum]